MTPSQGGPARRTACALLLFALLAASPRVGGALDWTSDAELPLAYGGILSMFDDETTATTEDVVEAVGEAVRHLLQRGGERHMPGTPFHRRLPQSLAALHDGQRAQRALAGLPRIRLLSRHWLRYTKDGVDPFVYRYRDHFGRTNERPVILGINYHFDLEWDRPPVGWGPAVGNGTHVHRFVITQDRSHIFSVLTHTSFLRTEPPRRVRIPNATLAYSGLGEDVWVTDVGRGERRRRVVLSKALLRGVGLPTSSKAMGSIVTLLNGHQYRHGELDKVLKPGALVAACVPSSPFPVLSVLPSLRSRRGSRAGMLRMMSYNIWNINMHDQGLYHARLAKLAAQIRAADVDIVALQEVRHDAKRDSQPKSLAAYLPEYSFVYQPAMSYPEEIFLRVEEGTAVLSRWPVLAHDYILLPRDITDPSDVHQRALLRVLVDGPLGPTSVFLTHLALSERARDDSVVKMWKWMSSLPTPQILVGDLNAEPETRAMMFLRGEAEISGVKMEGTFDAWLAKHPEPRPAAEYKYNETRDWGLTFNTLWDRLGKRIDYALLRLSDPALHLCDIEPYPAHDLRAPASDHVGLVFNVARGSSPADAGCARVLGQGYRDRVQAYEMRQRAERGFPDQTPEVAAATVHVRKQMDVAKDAEARAAAAQAEVDKVAAELARVQARAADARARGVREREEANRQYAEAVAGAAGTAATGRVSDEL